MNVVVVESPAKAKTINKYLGSGYRVLASYGHVRDLTAKEGSVRPDEDFAMAWQVDPRAQAHIKKIVESLKDADHLYLATDPDREGEAISWHLCEVLRQKGALDRVEVKRVVFYEITRSAVLDALKNPRDLDRELVDAYLARRALDYLVGFTLSPVLWRKLPGSRSAGRVQSVALRLICDRESEIERFRKQEYWSVAAAFRTPKGEPFTAELVRLDGRKLDRLGISDRAAAESAIAQVRAGSYRAAAVERRQVRRHPAPPFTTSTLQQEASRKLRLTARRTMQIAQRLYEGIDVGGETVGLITYMRTDAVNMARESVDACRRLIPKAYGPRYLPDAPRAYRTKAKNAQEAHEAIRPTDVFRRPADLKAHLDDEALRLYELIWKRTLASQMESAVLDQVAIDAATADGATGLRATGSVVVFDGFLTLYQEGRDDPDEDGSVRLPDVQPNEALALGDVTSEQHFTQPPPRYSEASLVKKLEELGIGRPSTYATIISVLQDREYVRFDKRRFMPEDRGRLVTAFLESFFEKYVQFGFTAEMEEKLDDISGGRVDWKTVLREFWEAFSRAVDDTKNLRVRDVLDALNDLLGPHFFPDAERGEAARACPSCAAGRLSLKLGKFGAFIGCSNYPECRYTRPLVVNGEGAPAGGTETGPRILGVDPESKLEISVRKGPYGYYVQEGEAAGKEKPKRTSVPRTIEPATLDLERARKLLALPRTLGSHPDTGEPVVAGIGRFGPYVKHGGTYVSLKDDDVLEVGLNRAVILLAGKPMKPAPHEIGKHPADGRPITARAGRYGAYVQHGTLRASLPKGTDGKTVDLATAVALLDAKRGPGKGKGKAKAAKAAAAPESPADAEAPAPAQRKRAAGGKPKAGSKPKPPGKTAAARGRKVAPEDADV